MAKFRRSTMYQLTLRLYLRDKMFLGVHANDVIPTIYQCTEIVSLPFETKQHNDCAPAKKAFSLAV